MGLPNTCPRSAVLASVTRVALSEAVVGTKVFSCLLLSHSNSVSRLPTEVKCVLSWEASDSVASKSKSETKKHSDKTHVLCGVHSQTFDCDTCKYPSLFLEVNFVSG